MFVYAWFSTFHSSAMAAISSASEALSSVTTTLIRSGSPASRAASMPRRNAFHAPRRWVSVSKDSSLAPYMLTTSRYGGQSRKSLRSSGRQSSEPLVEMVSIIPACQAYR